MPLLQAHQPVAVPEEGEPLGVSFQLSPEGSAGGTGQGCDPGPVQADQASGGVKPQAGLEEITLVAYRQDPAIAQGPEVGKAVEAAAVRGGQGEAASIAEAPEVCPFRAGGICSHRRGGHRHPGSGLDGTGLDWAGLDWAGRRRGRIGTG